MPQRFVVAARWIVPVEPRRQVLGDHALAVEDGRIVALAPCKVLKEQFPSEYWPWVELKEHLLIPGFINAHTHAAMALLRGVADDLPLERWLKEAIWPLEQALVSPQFVYEGSWLAAAEMIRSGICTALDMYFFPEEALRAFHEAGLRAALGLVALDFPTPYAAAPSEYIAKAEALLERKAGDEAIIWMLAPHAPYSVGDELFKALIELAKRFGVRLHIHLNETAHETPDSLARYGCSPVERLRALGALELPLVAAHGVHLTDSELAILQAHEAALVHCPTSNLKLASGIARVSRWLEMGLVAALGTDGAASNNRLDLLAEMRLASLLAKVSAADAAALDAFTALEMATIMGARALGIADETGSLAVGKSADLVAFDLSGFMVQPLFDPLSHLVWVLERAAISDVWIRGVAKMRHRQLLLQKSDKELSAIAEKWREKALFLRQTFRR